MSRASLQSASTSTFWCVTGRRLLPSGREALRRAERDELRRLVDERTRERLGFGVSTSARLRELTLALLAERPSTCAEIARTLRVSEVRVRGALRTLQLQGVAEVWTPGLWQAGAVLSQSSSLANSYRFRPMRGLAALLVLGYLVGTVLLGVAAAVSGEFACSQVECSRESPWYDDADAWQWDAMIVLGLASVPVGLAALAAAVTARRALAPALLLALHASAIGMAVALMLVASVVNRAQLTLAWLATVGAGTALIYVRRRQA